jgi:hypothetical protein
MAFSAYNLNRLAPPLALNRRVRTIYCFPLGMLTFSRIFFFSPSLPPVGLLPFFLAFALSTSLYFCAGEPILSAKEQAERK